MSGRQMRIAKLGKEKLAKVQALEKEFGCCLVALEPKVRFADLSEQQLKIVRDAEKELGVVLLAYEVGSRRK